MDDESGGTIACQVNPPKVYAKEIVAHNRGVQDRESASSLSRLKAQQEKPKSDPRLWIYRYQEPPRPALIAAASNERQKATYEPPIYIEGTLVRAVCRIVVNYKSGERMLEALSAEAIDTRAAGSREKYAEWHHAREAMRLRREVYNNREQVRKVMLDEGKEQEAAEKEKPIPEGSIIANAASDWQDGSMTTAAADGSQDSVMTSFTSSLVRSQDFLEKSDRQVTHVFQMNATAFDYSASLSAPAGGSLASPKAKSHKLPSLRRIAAQKIPVTRSLLLLYIKQHFHSLQKAHTTRSSLLSAAPPLEAAAGEVLGASKYGAAGVQGCAISAEQLKQDKALDWLATKCAKAEALAEVGLDSTGPAKGKADRSIISSSASAATLSRDQKPKLRADYVHAKKGKLFSWAIKELFKDGAIFVHVGHSPAATAVAAAPHSAASATRRCLSPKDRNLPALSSCLCTSSATRSRQPDGKAPAAAAAVARETYSLVTPEALLPVLEPIVVRLATAWAPQMVTAEMTLAALKRQDEMFRHVCRETIERALEIL